MKKFTFLFGFVLILVFYVNRIYSQTITLTFSGEEDMTGSYVSMDSIFIRNMTQGCDTILQGQDTVFTLNPLGINEKIRVEREFELIQNYPNPFKEKTTFGIRTGTEQHLEVYAFDLLGRKMAEYSGRFSSGVHLFTFTGGESNFYIITVTNGVNTESIKLISRNPASSSEHSIGYLGYQPYSPFTKASQLEGDFSFSMGDMLLFVGFAEGYEQSVTYDSPEVDTDYTLSFEIPGTFVCGEDFTDERDGQTYSTIEIGRQCWMTENLNIGSRIDGAVNQQDNGEIEKYCYGDDEANCDQFGGLYQWDEIMQYDTARFNAGLCPEGWHLPTMEEWNRLIDYAGGPSVAGDSLKAGGPTGFEALMAGYRNETGIFTGLNQQTGYWSSVYHDNTQSYATGLTGSGSAVTTDISDRSAGYSLRCVKGLPILVDTNVVKIDTNVYELISDSVELSNGIYKYQYNNLRKAADIGVSDVIIGVTDQGYLRKVNSVSDDPPILTLETSQATMEDVFEQGEFDFSLNLDELEKSFVLSSGQITYLAEGVTLTVTKEGGFEYTFNDVDIYNDGNFILKVTNGSVMFDPEFEFEFKFKKGVVKKLAFYADESELDNSIDVEFIAEYSNSIEHEKTLATYQHTLVFFIGWVPVVVVTNLDLIAATNFDVDANFNMTTGYTNNNTVSLGVKYEYGQWSKIWELEQDNYFHPLEYSGSINLSEKLSLIPEVSVMLYGVAGPYFNTDLWEQFVFNMVAPSFDVDAALDVGLDANVGARIEIFGVTLAEYNKFIPGFDLNIWTMPDEVTMISGNNQTGPVNQPLPDPVKVKVTDNYSNTFSNIPVHFEITQGDGTLSDYDVMTDVDGYAETFWTLGPTPGDNKLTASVVKTDGSHVNGSPIEFEATAEPSGGLPVVTTAPVTEITETTATCGGNVIDEGGYPVTERGVCWSTSTNPSINDDHTVDGSGPGAFVSYLTGLTENTTYYVKAYATNTQGTAYGSQEQFVTVQGGGLPVVTTGDAQNISQNSAEVTGEIIDLGGSDIIHHGHCWSESPNPNVNDYNTDLGSATATGTFTSTLDNLNSNTTYYVKAYAENNAGVAYGYEISFITSGGGMGEPCPGIETITYEGQVYNTVLIGEQCWLKESLNAGTRIDGGQLQDPNNGVLEKYCYDDDNANCDEYGGLYQWNEMMQGSTTPGAQGICPTGWHIATEDEWQELFDYLGGNNAAGGKIKEEGTLHWQDPNTGATNESNFTALGAGSYIGTFYSKLFRNHLWTSDQFGSQAVFWELLYVSAGVSWTAAPKSDANSVRCLKDEGGTAGEPCPGMPTVTYEGQEYNTVLIGAQCWLKENLNVGAMINGSQNQTNNGTIEKYCYDNDPSNCATYGGLYQWNEAMEYSTTPGVQGICPSGWHLPTDEEWKQLEGAVDSQYGYPDPEWDDAGLRGYDAGLNLKATSGWNSGGNGTDLYGFGALPGGGRSTNGSFGYLGYRGHWWSSCSGSYAWVRGLYYGYDGSDRDDDDKASGRSVRCLQD